MRPFKLERYLAQYEFSAPYLMCCSDCEPLSMKDLVAGASEKSREMWDNLNLSYTDSQGHPALRAEIAAMYEGIDPGQVLTVVPEEGIFIAMSVLLKPGDHIVVTFPGYQSLYEVARARNCQITQWRPEERNGKWVFDVDDLEKLLRDDTRLLVVNFPHNPTGTTVTPDEYTRIVEIVRKKDIYLFSDEMYRYLEFNEQNRLPAAVEVFEKGITLFGLSKTFALPGLRLGWLALQDRDLLAEFVNFKDYTTICGSAPSEILGIMALEQKERIIATNKAIIKENLMEIENFLDRHENVFDWNRPSAGTIALAQLRAGVSASRFCKRLVEEKGVLLVPSRVYDFGDNYLRFGFGRKNFPQALALLEDFLLTY